MTKDSKEKDTHQGGSHDVRIIERNLKRGMISRKEYEKFLKSLPDSKDKVKPSAE